MVQGQRADTRHSPRRCAARVTGISPSSKACHELRARKGLISVTQSDPKESSNTDIISRPIDVSVNGGTATRYWFKNAWSWGNCWSRTLPVVLKKGANSIALYNDPANGRTATGCPAPCRPLLDSEWAPNLDRFEVAPVRAP